MSATRNILAAVLAAGAAATALTGCGGDEEAASAPILRPAADRSADAGPFAALSGRQVLDRAVAAMRTAPALTLDANVTGGKGTFHITAALTRAGKCAVAASVSGEDVQLIGTGKTYYLKAGAGYWASEAPNGEAMAELLDGKWLKFPEASAGDNGFTGFCDLQGMLDGLDENLDEGTVAKGRATTLDGRAAVPVVHTTSEETTTVYVAATGLPYALKAVVSGGSEPGVITYSDYGKVPRIAAPPAGQTVDLGALGVPDDFSV